MQKKFFIFKFDKIKKNYKKALPKVFFVTYQHNLNCMALKLFYLHVSIKVLLYD